MPRSVPPAAEQIIDVEGPAPSTTGDILHRANLVQPRERREYGLPRAILSDNGSPFGSPGLARLSGLSLRVFGSRST